ncbi:alpha/beta-hydrolase [Violaceomyces palustris]|uniref:Alpha/beta-hydrolase n=1 Tax=Violaceomyces palustris TaxID=1673888 RepID=A0ACD0NP44_9BASI|nr:alpha/beta-hydrolase [Violaceomyces palustris]
MSEGGGSGGEGGESGEEQTAGGLGTLKSASGIGGTGASAGSSSNLSQLEEAGSEEYGNSSSLEGDQQEGDAVGEGSSNEGDGCSSLELVSARGTSEPQSTLGFTEGALFRYLKQLVPSATAYNVRYSSDLDYLKAPQDGAKDVVNHIQSLAQECPQQKFAIAGYSKGAMVVHESSAGLKGFRDRIVAAVTFGDPFKMMNGAGNWPTGDLERVKVFCNKGDPICLNGMNVVAHLKYPLDGSAQAGAKFIAQWFQKMDGQESSLSSLEDSRTSSSTNSLD